MSKISHRKAKSKVNDNGRSFIKNDASFHPGSEAIEDEVQGEEGQTRLPSKAELRAAGAIAVKKGKEGHHTLH